MDHPPIFPSAIVTFSCLVSDTFQLTNGHIEVIVKSKLLDMIRDVPNEFLIKFLTDSVAFAAQVPYLGSHSIRIRAQLENRRVSEGSLSQMISFATEKLEEMGYEIIEYQ